MDESKHIDDYLVDNDASQLKTSHALLKQTYTKETCVSCAQEYSENEMSAEYAAWGISQVCGDMWHALFPDPHPARYTVPDDGERA